MLFEYLLSLASHIALFWSLKFLMYTSNTLIYLVWTTTTLATWLQLHLLSDSFHIVTGAELSQNQESIPQWDDEQVI